MTCNYPVDSEMNNLLQMTNIFLVKVKQQTKEIVQ